MTRPVLLLLLVHTPAALLLSLPGPLLRAPASPLRLCRPLMCAEEDVQPAAAEEPAVADDPKAAAKAEKAALRAAIADLEARLPNVRGDLVAAQDAAKDSGENGYMLLAANFERFRQQARSEIDSQKGYGRVAAVRALLPFAETFEALQVGADADAADIHKYYGGIYKQSQQLLESWKVAPYEAVPGEPFNIRVHQSVERVPSDDVADGIILAAVERGWKMEEDVVRLATCTVSSGAPVAAAEPAADEADASDEAATEAEAAAE